MNDNVNASTTFWFVIVHSAKWKPKYPINITVCGPGQAIRDVVSVDVWKVFVNDNLICATVFASESQRLIRPHIDRSLKRTPQLQSPKIISPELFSLKNVKQTR